LADPNIIDPAIVASNSIATISCPDARLKANGVPEAAGMRRITRASAPRKPTDATNPSRAEEFSVSIGNCASSSRCPHLSNNGNGCWNTGLTRCRIFRPYCSDSAGLLTSTVIGTPRRRYASKLGTKLSAVQPMTTSRMARPWRTMAKRRDDTQPMRMLTSRTKQPKNA